MVRTVVEQARDRLDGERVLVTGATGFLGGHVVRLLGQHGAEVHATHRRDAPQTGFGPQPTWHHADLTEASDVDAVVHRVAPSHIIHLAGLVTGSRDPNLIAPMVAANATSTLHLLDAARRAGVRRVQVAGSLEEPVSGDEVPASPYALSKALAHLIGDYYAKRTELEVVHLQIFMVYGPAQLDETKLVPYVARNALAGTVPELSSGDRAVDWVYVEDVAEGIVRCCVADLTPRCVVPLGTGRSTTVREVVEMLIELSAAPITPHFGSIAERSNEVVRVADVELTHQQLGWAPATSLTEGLGLTLDWYRSTGAP